MCLLRKAAEAWEKLLNFRYDMVFGRKKKSYVVSLSFERYDFPHLVGMQYANDVDFKINSAEYYGEKLITAILSGQCCKLSSKYSIRFIFIIYFLYLQPILQ